MQTQKTGREERPPAQFWLLFLNVFSPPPGLALLNWASQECYFCFAWHPHSGPQTFLCSILGGFFLPYLLVTIILHWFFPVLTT